MIWIDYVFVAILAAGLGYGLWTGLVWQAANVVGIMAALLVAGHVSDPIGHWIVGWGEWFARHPRLWHGLAYLLLFVGVWAGFRILAHAVRTFLRAAKFGTADCLLGGLVGLFAGLLVCAALATILLPAAGNAAAADAASESALAPVIVRELQRSRVFLSDEKIERARLFLESLAGKVQPAEVGNGLEASDASEEDDTP